MAETKASKFWACGKLRLCSANHRPDYWSNLPCEWPSIAWAYFEQQTENGPRSGTWMSQAPTASKLNLRSPSKTIHWNRITNLLMKVYKHWIGKIPFLINNALTLMWRHAIMPRTWNIDHIRRAHGIRCRGPNASNPARGRTLPGQERPSNGRPDASQRRPGSMLCPVGLPGALSVDILALLLYWPTYAPITVRLTCTNHSAPYAPFWHILICYFCLKKYTNSNTDRGRRSPHPAVM